MKTLLINLLLLVTFTASAQSDSLQLEETYDEVHNFTMYQWVDDDNLEEKNCWLGLNNATNEWVVMNEKLEAIAKRKGGKFVMEYGDLIIFDEGDHIEVLNPFTGSTDIKELRIDSYRELKLEIGSPISVVNEEGEYILPPEGKEIVRVEVDSTKYWFAMDEDGSIVVDINGDVVGNFPEYQYAYSGCHEKGYFFVRKGAKWGSLQLDKATGHFKILHPAIYNSFLRCSTGEEKYYALTEDREGGTIIHLFPDGSVRIQNK